MTSKQTDELIARLRVKWAVFEEQKELAKEPMRRRLSESKAFDGHICTIPSAEKRKLRELWLCDCNQWWELCIYNNNRSWKMIGKRVVSVDAKHRAD